MKNTISITDLRVKYKLETGYHPVHMKNRRGKTLRNPNPRDTINNFYGNPTTDYGRWIEDSFKEPMKIREKYQSLFPERKKAVRKCPYSRVDIYSADYSLWLEEKLLEKI